MYQSRSSTASRRARGVRQYQGRSYGGSVAPTAVKPDGPSKREQAAEDALQAVLDLFESGDLPARVAQTFIARADGCSPMVHWSLGNQLLALLAGTSDARGYRQWQEVGRHVVKGAKAFYILAPRTRKVRDTDESGDESERVIVTGFLGIPVFRYEDTDGDALDVPDYAPPVCPPLFEVAERFGIPVAYQPFVRDFAGFYSPGDDRIVLCTHDARVFLHELAHAAHARVLAAKGTKILDVPEATREVVAELTAAVLCKLLDLDGYIANSRDYIARYGNGNPGRAAMRVLADVQAVLMLILETADEPAASERELVAA